MTTAGTLYAAATQNRRLQCGVLRYVDANTLSYLPYNGDRLKINGVWQAIPTTGIVGLTRTGAFVNGAASQTLATSTGYFVYAFMNGAVMTADFSTTTHATSTTAGNEGVEIKSGDNTRTLIGQVWNTSTPGFADTVTFRLVRSWFNREATLRDMRAAYTAQRATATATFTELFSGESRLTFLAWANELVTAHICGESSMDTAGFQTFTRISFDGAGVGQAWNAADVTRVNGAADGSTAWQSCYTSDSQSGFSEAAQHYVTETHAVNGGTAYFGSTSLGVFNSLTACIRD